MRAQLFISLCSTSHSHPLTQSTVESNAAYTGMRTIPADLLKMASQDKLLSFAASPLSKQPRYNISSARVSPHLRDACVVAPGGICYR